MYLLSQFSTHPIGCSDRLNASDWLMVAVVVGVAIAGSCFMGTPTIVQAWSDWAQTKQQADYPLEVCHGVVGRPH